MQLNDGYTQKRMQCSGALGGTNASFALTKGNSYNKVLAKI